MLEQFTYAMRKIQESSWWEYLGNQWNKSYKSDKLYVITTCRNTWSFQLLIFKLSRDFCKLMFVTFWINPFKEYLLLYQIYGCSILPPNILVKYSKPDAPPESRINEIRKLIFKWWNLLKQSRRQNRKLLFSLICFKLVIKLNG